MADRYTVLTRKPEHVPDAIEAAESLGLKWFVRSDWGSRRDVMVYLFFDEDGLQKFLSKEWGNKLDDMRDWVHELREGKIDEAAMKAHLFDLFPPDEDAVMEDN